MIRFKILDKKTGASFLLACVIWIKCFNAIIGLFIRTSRIPISVIVVGLILGIYLFYSIQNGLFVHKRVVLLLLYIVVCFLLSSFKHPAYFDKELSQFCCFALVGLLVGSLDFDTEVVLNYCSKWFVALIVPIGLLMLENYRANGLIDMGLSYAVLPTAFAPPCYFYFYREKTTLLTRISAVFSFLVILCIVVVGTRGAVIGTIYLAFLCFLYQKKLSSKNLWIFLTIVVVTLIAMNFEAMLTALNEVMQNRGVSINFLNKTLRLIRAGDFSNGRAKHYELAWQGFLNSPILGNGIGMFAEWYPQMTYPHNIFLQVLFELGLFGLPIIVLSFKLFVASIYGGNLNDNKKVAIVLIASGGLVRLLFTGMFWECQLTWAGFAMLLTSQQTVRANLE